MKKVLLIGDSITGGYSQKVTELLDGKYEVYRVSDNCRFSAYTLNSLRFWLGEQNLPEAKCAVKNPDIIHWNNGLWDVAHINGENRCFTSLEEYLSNMERIAEYLRKVTSAKIILATTTPTRKEKEYDKAVGHFVSDITKYNKALKERLADKVDAIDDLFSLVEPQIDKVIKTDDLIHLTDYGKEVCGNAVVQSIINVDK